MTPLQVLYYVGFGVLIALGPMTLATLIQW
jgi:hypothetical protein